MTLGEVPNTAVVNLALDVVLILLFVAPGEAKTIPVEPTPQPLERGHLVCRSITEALGLSRREIQSCSHRVSMTRIVKVVVVLRWPQYSK